MTQKHSEENDEIVLSVMIDIGWTGGSPDQSIGPIYLLPGETPQKLGERAMLLAGAYQVGRQKDGTVLHTGSNWYGYGSTNRAYAAGQWLISTEKMSDDVVSCRFMKGDVNVTYVGNNMLYP